MSRRERAEAERMMADLMRRLRVLSGAIDAPELVIDGYDPAVSGDADPESRRRLAHEELRRIWLYACRAYQRDPNETRAARQMVIRAVEARGWLLTSQERAKLTPEEQIADLARRVAGVREELHRLGLDDRPVEDAVIEAALYATENRAGRGGVRKKKSEAIEALWRGLRIAASYDDHARSVRRK